MHAIRDSNFFHICPRRLVSDDAGNAQIAVLTGMFENENYNWRSQTMPGITGLFNKFCLATATANLMTCAPGDNTFDGVFSTVSLVSDVSEFHSIYTTEDTSGECLLPSLFPSGIMSPVENTGVTTPPSSLESSFHGRWLQFGRFNFGVVISLEVDVKSEPATSIAFAYCILLLGTHLNSSTGKSWPSFGVRHQSITWK